jgi:hypothetical protein
MIWFACPDAIHGPAPVAAWLFISDSDISNSSVWWQRDLDIVCGRAQNSRIVSGETKRNIAILAKQPTRESGGVVVIYI